MIIRKTQEKDIAAVLSIYDMARTFMRRCGNLSQWTNGYPSAETLRDDMAAGCSYVCINDSGKVVGTFFFILGEEPTYAEIFGGQWLDATPYGVIHRAASDGSVKGLMHHILDFCFARCNNIRIDTHRDNLVMQNSLLRYGFHYCGIIHLLNGDERLAYQLRREELSHYLQPMRPQK